MSSVALISPPLLTERLLSYAAKTDVASFQRYDNCVRKFHLNLREFHYPMLFGDVEYSSQKMAELPTFKACTDAGV
jgi:ABC-2 type transport system permease protein